MGSGIARALIASGHRVITDVSARSARTRGLANVSGVEIVDEATLLQEADIILSILVPSKAMELATTLAPKVASLGSTTKPIYIDCNAIAPSTVIEISKLFSTPFVDGSIIGGPPDLKTGYQPSIYLSGDYAKAEEILSTGLVIKTLGPKIGQASGVKMCYASVAKGTTAILTQAFSVAKSLGIGPELAQEMAETQPAMMKKASNSIPSMAPKAYRWHGEMREIAKTYEEAGIGGGIFTGAAELYEFIAETPLGKEIVEDRKIGKDLDSALEIIARAASDRK